MVETAPETVKQHLLTDCHCHLLPGLDDGPAEIQEAVEIAQVLVSFGFSDVYCTPHLMTGVYKSTPEMIRHGASTLQKVLDADGIPLRIHTAAEYYLDEYLLNALATPLPLSSDILLIEIPSHIQPTVLKEILYRLIARNRLRPLIAHPERCDVLALDTPKPFGKWFKILEGRKHSSTSSDDLPLFLQLKEMGCLFQGNIGSFAGIYGELVMAHSHRLLDQGMYDCLGTDAHHSSGLEQWLIQGMRAVARKIGNEGLRRLLRPLALSTTTSRAIKEPMRS
jgi:protein-tyrosine phosphatase